MSAQAILDLASRFTSAIEKGDVATVKSIYAPHAGIWHNNDGVTQTVSENLVVLGGLIKGTVSRSYENLRVRVYQGPGDEKGFVQQHVLVARAADGGSMRLEAIIVCAVDKDAKHIVKLDEYFDQKVVDKWVAERVAAATKAKI